jgi:hypothetical protein
MVRELPTSLRACRCFLAYSHPYSTKSPDDMEAIRTCDSAWHAEHALADLAQHMAHGRAHRLRTAEPLPEALWERAVAFTAVFPRTRVAKRLGLSGRRRKQRWTAQQGDRSDLDGRPMAPDAGPAVPLDCVELPAPSAAPLGLTGVAASPGQPPRGEGERQRADGARLRLHSHEPPPLEAVVRIFLAARA